MADIPYPQESYEASWPPQKPQRRPGRGLWRPAILLVIACLLSSAFTLWGAQRFGVFSANTSTNSVETREKVVMQEGEVIANIFETVSPSTVAVTTEGVAQQSQFFGGSYTTEGAGSGVIISNDGYVLTNKHVVPDGSTQVTITTADGKEYTNVAIVGRDPINDVAFLKIPNVKDLPAASLGDSATVKPGQKVIAIGNALGEFRNSVTAGIISGLGRPITAAGESSGAGAETLENLFQTDTAINPGNSGGPLLNYKGEVIGINTAIAQDSQNIGFAIPINDVKGLIKGVVEQGKIIRPYLGVRYLTLDATTQQQLRLPVSEGAYVLNDGQSPAVVPGSPAARADIRSGDIITKVDDQSVDASHSLLSQLSQHQPGDKVKLTVLRDGKERTTEVTLEAYPQ